MNTFIKTKGFVLFLIQLPFLAWGFCETAYLDVANVQIDRDYNATSNWCHVSISPRYINDHLIYRSYLITNDGLLMVFNSFSEGATSTETGAREFYFFPRPIQDVQIHIENTPGSEVIQVLLSANHWLSFNPQTADLSYIEEGEIQVDPQISKNNRGGVEILKYNGVYLDTGFTFGHSPSEDLNNKSYFKDANGKSCPVINSKIFEKINNQLTPRSDSDISKILRTLCPQLKVDF